MKKKSKKITKKELAEKIGLGNLTFIEGNVYCAECGATTIVGYEKDIAVEPSGDTILRGNGIGVLRTDTIFQEQV